ncbi:DUF2303 family protein [Aureimonas sp. AU40]|uniref:DUF2303 family protein n=1 Tax=Aureimonas sp. AU40 TaxID=1637747 RepID=UPI000782885A|nr:DUF2303 family protein [Aureimonas sp. AU40]
MSQTTENAEGVLLPSNLHLNETLRLDGDAVDKLAELGSRATGVEILKIDDLPASLRSIGLMSFPLALVHGENPKLQSLKSFAEEWRDTPEFRRGQAKALTLDSFIALVNRHKVPDTSVVFADSNWKAPSLTAVIDYHQTENAADTDAPGWGKHRVHYPFPLSEEWKRWIKDDGQPMEQAEFAAMIEDRMTELAAPDDGLRIMVERDFQTTVATPSQLITLSRGLQINVESKVKDMRTLQSGASQVVFEETHTGADGQPLAVPGVFVIRVSPFFMGDPILIPVRLRYRVRSGKIMWFYQIYRPDASITEAVRAAMQDVAAKTELQVFEGTPEMRSDGAIVSGVGGA